MAAMEGEGAVPTIEPQVSALRHLLGERPIELIATTTRFDFERAKSLFLESGRNARRPKPQQSPGAEVYFNDGPASGTNLALN